jgi:signal transduction histidine kinase
MSSLIFISLYLVVCLIVLGFTKSISDTHYKWVEKFGFWGYPIFPASMIIWAILVGESQPELWVAAISIILVGIYAAFKDDPTINLGHYFFASVGIIYLLIVIWSWCFWLVLSFIGLSIFALYSPYRIYIIEVLAIVLLYIYRYGALPIA